jgi:hypothetical protein
MTTTIEPGTVPGPAPAPQGTDTVPHAHEPAPHAHGDAPRAEHDVPPARESAPPTRERDRAGTLMRLLMWGLILGGLVISTIGFAASYGALRDLALAKGFGAMSRYVPIGIDVGIVVMYGWDLVLAWRRKPKPMLRWIGHLLTFATIAFNANATGKPFFADLVGAGYHATMPVLFIAMVEAARHLVIRTAQVRLGESSPVGLHRWLLAPWQTWLLWRRTKLWQMPARQVVELEKSRKVYQAWLQHKYGKKKWKRAARAEELLPFTLAAYGLGVEEALALPATQQAAETARQKAEEARQEAAVAAEELRRIEAERRTAKAAIERRRIAAMVTAADHEIDAETTTAEAQARVAKTSAAAHAETAARTAQLTAEAALRKAERDAAEAERVSAREEAAVKSAAEAEALAREAAALLAQSNDRKAAADTAAEAARTERAAAEAARAAEEHRLMTTRLAADVKAAAAAAAEAEQRTAQAREKTARAELAAREAEDAARLSPRERDDRRVARMLLAAGVTVSSTDPKDKETVSLEAISAALGVQSTAAGQRRQAAYDLIKAGYTG